MLMFPVNYIYITQLYKKGVHNGVDIRGKYAGRETDILSPADGTVISIRNNYKTQDSSGNSYGNFIKIDHGNGISSLMAHLKYNSIKVNVGDKVTKSQKLAVMGTTGHSTGIHVHYEIFKNGIKVNPLDYTYVHLNQFIDDSSRKFVKFIDFITPVQRDNKINQLKVNVDKLNIREDAGKQYYSKGYVKKDSIYNYTEVKKMKDYTWYKIGNNAWIANEGTYLTILEKDEYKFYFKVKETNTYIIHLNKGEELYIK